MPSLPSQAKFRALHRHNRAEPGDLGRGHPLEIEHPDQLALPLGDLRCFGGIRAADQERLGGVEIVVIVGPVPHHRAIGRDSARGGFGGEKRSLDPAH